MGIISDKLDQKIRGNDVTKYGDTIAIVTGYDNIKNTASIKFTNPNGGSVLTATNISMETVGGGLSQSAPTIGQKCWITFLGSNLLSPVISSFFDDEYYDNVYSKKSTADQGAYLISSFINDIDTDSIIVKAMIEDYEDSEASKQKYTAAKEYVNTDSTVIIRKLLMEIDKYKSSEDGITNTLTNSTVKFKDNGEIDVFVSNNTGIRINPNTKNISFFGKTLNTTVIDSWTIEAPEVIIKGNLKVSGNITKGDES